MLRILLFIGILSIQFAQGFSQDTIVMRDDNRIVCKVKEIGTDEVKYTLPNSNLVMGIDKNLVLKVILASGMIMNFQNSMNNPENYVGQRKNCLKFRLLSPLYGYSDFTYERSLKPGASMEFSLGIVGLGNHYGESFGGVSFRVGYKFIKSPDFYLQGLRYAHILKGVYLEPELGTSIYEKNGNHITAGALMFVVGDQWIFNNIAALDLYFGLGYGFSSTNSFNIQYGYSTGSGGTPIAITSGFRIGFLF